MKNIKKGSVLIYILILVTLSITFATIILNNNSYLSNMNYYFDTDSILYKHINDDSKMIVSTHILLNSNGSGFIDNIACPKEFTMSGNTIKDEDIDTLLTYSGNLDELYFCSGSFNNKNISIFFKSDYSDLIRAEYDNNTLNINSGALSGTFGDSENTLLDLENKDNYYYSDDIDDNFNSDNYSVTSTGSTSTGVYYSSGYQDDDVLMKKRLFGYVILDNGFKKIFWNTSKYLKIINDNINNNDNLNIKIGNVENGYLYLEIDKNADIKIVNFDKENYDNTRELIVLNSIQKSILVGSGYIQKDGSLGNGDNYSFDFKNKNYAIFIKSDESLFYDIKAETDTGTGVYITPIDDSNDKIIKYLGNEIIINDKGLYISKESNLIYNK